MWGPCPLATFNECKNNIRAAKVIYITNKLIKDEKVQAAVNLQDLGYIYKRKVVCGNFPNQKKNCLSKL